MRTVQQKIWFALLVVFFCTTTRQGIFAVELSESVKVFTTQNSDLPSNEVFDVTVDRLGRVWMSTGSLSLFLTLFHNDVWKTFPGVGAIEISTDKDGNAWIASGMFSGALTKCDGVTTIHYNDQNSGIPSDWTSGVTVDNNNTVWVACSFTGVGEFDGTTWKKHLDASVGSGGALPMAHSPNNTIWLGTQTGLYRYQNEQWQHFTTENSELPGSEVLSLVCANDNSVWVGTTNGTVHIESTKWTVFNMQNSPLPSNAISALAVDSSGIVWIGTDKGIATYDHTMIPGVPWMLKTKENWVLPSNTVRSIAIAPGEDIWGTQAVWISTDQGVLRVTQTVTDVADNNAASVQLRVSPNPVAHRADVHLSLAIPSVLDIALYNIRGEKVASISAGELSAGTHVLPFNVQTLPEGVYHCTASANGRVISSQRVLIHR